MCIKNRNPHVIRTTLFSTIKQETPSENSYLRVSVYPYFTTFPINEVSEHVFGTLAIILYIKHLKRRQYNM